MLGLGAAACLLQLPCSACGRLPEPARRQLRPSCPTSSGLCPCCWAGAQGGTGRAAQGCALHQGHGVRRRGLTDRQVGLGMDTTQGP